MVLKIYEACEVMSTEGTDMNKSLYNAFYGTYDEKYGERRYYRVRSKVDGPKS